MSELTDCTLDVVESKVGNSGVELQEERQRLSNSTAGTEDGNLGCLSSTAMLATSTQQAKKVKEQRKQAGANTYITGGGGESSPLDGANNLTSGEHDDGMFMG